MDDSDSLKAATQRAEAAEARNAELETILRTSTENLNRQIAVYSEALAKTEAAFYDFKQKISKVSSGHEARAALTLCIAALKARQEEKE